MGISGPWNGGAVPYKICGDIPLHSVAVTYAFYMVGAAIWKYIDRKNSRFLPSGNWTGHYWKWFTSLIYPWISCWFSDFPWFFGMFTRGSCDVPFRSIGTPRPRCGVFCCPLCWCCTLDIFSIFSLRISETNHWVQVVWLMMVNDG